MTATPTVEVTAQPLDRIVAIEASAGTGKTHTIIRLWLRLMLEERLPVERILLVTYTKAATQELRDRILSLLRAARRRLLQLPDPAGTRSDPLLDAILARVPSADAGNLVNRALVTFDEAAVFTIHGFCQRVLAEHAFESGRSFAVELVPDQSELLEEVADDFWRQRTHVASPAMLERLLDGRMSPGSLLAAVRPHLGKPDVEVVGGADAVDLAALEATFREAFARARTVWAAEAEVVRALVLGAVLHLGRYAEKSRPGWLEAMDRCLSAPRASLPLFEKFEKFTPEKLQGGRKAGNPVPAHPFFDACGVLLAARDRLRVALDAEVARWKADLLAYCRTELARRKARRREQSFDDLLLDLRAAVHHPTRGPRLAAAIRQRYPAALVDEFQDTDPVQYDIIRRIWGGHGRPVFLVGDPKQAIYTFRGADVFAYLAARADAGTPGRLDVNWRSDPLLIAAVNALFGRARHPFLWAGIPFVPAAPAPEAQAGRLVLPDDDGAPLRLLVWPARRRSR